MLFHPPFSEITLPERIQILQTYAREKFNSSIYYDDLHLFLHSGKNPYVTSLNGVNLLKILRFFYEQHLNTVTDNKFIAPLQNYDRQGNIGVRLSFFLAKIYLPPQFDSLLSTPRVRIIRVFVQSTVRDRANIHLIKSWWSRALASTETWATGAKSARTDRNTINNLFQARRSASRRRGAIENRWERGKNRDGTAAAGRTTRGPQGARGSPAGQVRENLLN